MGKKSKPYYMTIRHCRMRLNGIEEVLAELIKKVQDLHIHIDKVVKE